MNSQAMDTLAPVQPHAGKLIESRELDPRDLGEHRHWPDLGLSEDQFSDPIQGHGPRRIETLGANSQCLS